MAQGRQDATMTATRRPDSGTPDSGSTGSTGSSGSRGQTAVFRVPGTALIGVLMLFMGVFPFAASAPYLMVFLLIPIVAAVWIMRTRTVATREGLTVRTLLGTKELPWAAVKGLRITPKSTVTAVCQDDTTVALPSVRTRHLPVLSLVSEGRLPDPSGVLDEPTEPAAESDAEPGAEPEPGRAGAVPAEATGDATDESADDTADDTATRDEPGGGEKSG
ncbi:PH domain-containing protein [Saccharomonospora piscinae]|uniref:PH domain-containing protein n=1 Tax=Saccharomonospora piscinae TaxID=687388 RepID=UPI001FCA3BFF|nr:PH domain-containing protein [Saccharomonospora piscinae]